MEINNLARSEPRMTSTREDSSDSWQQKPWTYTPFNHSLVEQALQELDNSR